jgi:pimeloyl-ACP methyl ester carboxylesterase
MLRHPPRRRLPLSAAAVVCVLLVASCSSSGKSASTTTETTETTDTTETTATAASAAATTSPDTAADTSGPGTSSGSDSTDTPSTSADTTDTIGTDETADTDSTDDAIDAAGPTPNTTKTFGWTEKSEGVEEGHLEVPVDPTKPDGDTFDLYLVRHRALKQTERVGSLLVNPGGPGYGGTDLAEYADQIYGQDVLDHFDIVAWDPRGTGKSTPAVDCVDQYDPYFALDSSPDTPEEQKAIVSAATEFGEKCENKDGSFLPFVSTQNSAGDMDSIRAALGEDKISYFGFSYGSELGVSWASLYPKTVRAMVIDGAADTTADYLQQNLEQAAGFESTFDTFLATCAKDKQCDFYNGGDPGKAFDALNAAADADPVETTSGRPNVTQGVLTTAVSDAMYDESYWPQLETALADLQAGDGKGILALYDDYYERTDDGKYGNELEAYFAINCVDDPGTKDPDVLFGMQDEFAKVAPRLGASWILELQFCASWPVPAAPPVPIDAKGAGPIVVVGTTGDPATPLEGTRNTSEALEDGHLIVVTADQHTGYGVNDCVDSAVDNYLVSLVVPKNELACK